VVLGISALFAGKQRPDNPVLRINSEGLYLDMRSVVGYRDCTAEQKDYPLELYTAGGRCWSVDAAFALDVADYLAAKLALPRDVWYHCWDAYWQQRGAQREAQQSNG